MPSLTDALVVLRSTGTPAFRTDCFRPLALGVAVPNMGPAERAVERAQGDPDGGGDAIPDRLEKALAGFLVGFLGPMASCLAGVFPPEPFFLTFLPAP